MQETPQPELHILILAPRPTSKQARAADGCITCNRDLYVDLMAKGNDSHLVEMTQCVPASLHILPVLLLPLVWSLKHLCERDISII